MLENDYLAEQHTTKELLVALVNKIGKRTVSIFVGVLVLVIYIFYQSGLTNVLADDPQELEVTAGATEEENKDTITVDLAGAVNNPGIYQLSASANIANLIKLGGGYSNEVSAKWASQQVNLAQKLKDGQKLYVPFAWEFTEKNEIAFSINLPSDSPQTSPQEDPQSFTGEEVVGDSPIDDGSDGTLINVNTADQLSLESLPGIGKTYAQKIIDNRPYANGDEFKTKSGLSSSIIGKIANLITF